MQTLMLHHHNNCPLCPFIGAENEPVRTFFRLGLLNFDLRLARRMWWRSRLAAIHPGEVMQWLEFAHLDPDHVDHLPDALGPGWMVTLPSGWGRPIIDGTHCAAKALREGKDFLAFVLPEDATRKLLRRSMNPRLAEMWWTAMQRLPPLDLGL